MIIVENISKTYKRTDRQPGLKGAFTSLIRPKYNEFTAVKNLSFCVLEGEIMGFIGPNGAGKSTTIKMLTGILTPSSGICRINGQVPQVNRAAYVKNIGVVFGQRTQLWWDLPLQDTYKVLKEIYEIPEDRYKRQLNFLNEVLDLYDFINLPVRNLSLGQRMRADIAASLLHNPKVLFLDEPTIGLDIDVKERIRNAILKINKEENTTIILTTHDMSDIEKLCNRIFIIDQGEKVYDGPLSNLKEKVRKFNKIDFFLKKEIAEDFLVFKDFPDIEVLKDGKKLTVRFDTQLVSEPQLIKYVLENANVENLRITEDSIEKIIRQIYRKEMSYFEKN